MWTLLMITLGIVIGWQLPQPQWASELWTGIKRGFNRAMNRDGNSPS